MSVSAIREALELAMHANNRDFSVTEIERAAGQAEGPAGVPE